MKDIIANLLPFFLLVLALWISFRRGRKVRPQAKPRQPSDWLHTPEGRIDHLNKRREEEGG